MARQIFEYGPCPYKEDAAQLGAADYEARARRECAAFTGQIQRRCSPSPPGTAFQTKACPHDFGTYYEVGLVYDDAVPAHVDYAYMVESCLPGEWDALARIELGI